MQTGAGDASDGKGVERMGTVAGKPVSRRKVRTGDGEVVPRRWEQRQARARFMAALAVTAPDVYAELWAPEMAGLWRAMTETFRAWLAVVRGEGHDVPGRDAYARACVQCDAAYQAMHDGIEAWCSRWHLEDTWCGRAAGATTELASFPEDLRRKVLRLGYSGAAPPWFHAARGGPDDPRGLVVDDPFDCRALALPEAWPVFLDELGEPRPMRPVHLNPASDLIGTFDPRAETIGDAVTRLMPDLERRLRRALERIVAEDTAGDPVPVRALPPEHHFEWAVRYQVLGEEFTGIAKADGVKRQAVSQAVHNVAALIGLTPRNSDKGGRPRKRARCVKVSRKPATR